MLCHLLVVLAIRATTEVGAGPVPIERALVARAQAGDDGAFRRIFEVQAPGVRRLAGHLLRDADAAAEATQETFVRAHRGLAGLAEHDRLRPWLFGIARNVCMEQLRARKLSMRNDALDDIEEEALAHLDVPSPQDLLLRREADELLDVALQGLSPDRRTVLLLRLDHDLSYDEISHAMSWPLHKVKNEVRRARLGLRASLARYLGGQT